MISPADNSAGRPAYDPLGRPSPIYPARVFGPPPEPDPALDAEARALRDAVYGPCTDNNWLACREFWLTPDNVAWLREQAGKEPCKT